jgi:hypothetical protein
LELKLTFNSNAVLSYVYLGREIPQNSAVVKYVLGLVSDDQLFANIPGGRGNIKSTYQAIATLQALDSIASIPASVVKGLNAVLAAALTETESGKYFAFTYVPAVRTSLLALLPNLTLYRSSPTTTEPSFGRL